MPGRFSAGYGTESSKALTLTISWLVTGGVVAVGVFLLAAWATANNAIFTITTRRVLIQFGVVLRMTFNLPFKAIERASLKVNPDGSGDIVLTLTPQSQVNYVAMWPFVRPWRFERAEPMLRCVPDVAKVSDLLANAMAAAATARAVEHARRRPSSVRWTTTRPLLASPRPATDGRSAGLRDPAEANASDRAGHDRDGTGGRTGARQAGS